MPNNTGVPETARLLREIGRAVSMNYRCSGSGADTKDKAPNAFKNNFGYSSANFANYNYQTVMNELDQGRPVILSGGSRESFWIFGYYSGGHAWVCDGYRQYTDPCWGSYVSLHMNWGWEDGLHNAYYALSNFNPGSSSYNYKPGMIYNIKP